MSLDRGRVIALSGMGSGQVVCDDLDASFEAMLNEIADMSDLDATWLHVAASLLRFCAEWPPDPPAATGLPGGEPYGQIAALRALALSTLATADPWQANALNEPTAGSYFVGPLSFAPGPVRRALCDLALKQAAISVFDDRGLSLVTIARGLADAVDDLAGHTYLPWFRAKGEVALRPGQPYPVRRHNPKPWLHPHQPNSNPANTELSDLAVTNSLRIATELPFTCVIDFDCWNRLSPLGSEGRLIVAAAQPNTWLSEYTIDFHDGPPKSYTNHGPADPDRQALRICALAERAFALSADILLLPEYALNAAVHSELLSLNKDGTWLRPLIICAGTVDDADAEGYVENHGKLIINSRGMEHDFSVDTPMKSHQAPIGGALERIRRGTEVKVYTSENWTLCVLVCRDAIDSNVIAQLARIGVNMLLVPALSPKTAALVGSATELCHRSQAFVLIANGPARWGDSALQEEPASRLEAVFAGPYELTPNFVGATSRSDDVTSAAQTLWVYDFGQRSITTRLLYND